MKRKLALAILGLVYAARLHAAGTKPFDYVIVGAGAAGSVLANRLTENPHMRVLVLEAGGPDTDERIYRPAAFRQLSGSSFDWSYTTQEQTHLNQREIPLPRGKVWGGSGSISAMAYVRGHPQDFDRWARLGNEGWSYQDVLPYFKKAENQERGPSEYHGVGGPQNVADPRWVPPISLAFIDAALEIGLSRNEDFNAQKQEGVGLYQLNQKNGERHSAAAAYLRPALHRTNLMLESHALVTRILFENGRAVGVSYLQDEVAHEARATREVILAAGTIGSAQLLLLSGVGPADHLRSLDIPVTRDLPGVGGNLRDHPRVGITYRSKLPLGFDEERAARDYYLDREGPWSSNGVGAGAFVKLSEEDTAPGIQILLTANPSQSTFSLHAVLMYPRSQGQVRLRSKDATVYPFIQANYLLDERDLRDLVRGLEIARRIALADALRDYRGEELGPDPEVWEGQTIADYVRENVATFHHPVGTCKMGYDSLAVVDDRLRVHGLEALRVIDASVMPTLIRGATHAATIMIAEKGADLVKSDW